MSVYYCSLGRDSWGVSVEASYSATISCWVFVMAVDLYSVSVIHKCSALNNRFSLISRWLSTIRNVAQFRSFNVERSSDICSHLVFLLSFKITIWELIFSAVGYNFDFHECGVGGVGGVAVGDGNNLIVKKNGNEKHWEHGSTAHHAVRLSLNCDCLNWLDKRSSLDALECLVICSFLCLVVKHSMHLAIGWVMQRLWQVPTS